MIGALQRKEVDFGSIQIFWYLLILPQFTKKYSFLAIAFIVTSARSKVISFTLTLMSDYHLLYIKHPSDSMNYESYTEPFHYVTWLGIGLFCIVFPPFLWAAIQ